MPDRVVLIAVPAINEAAVVAVVGAIIKRDPAATYVASREPLVVAIAIPIANSAAPPPFAVAVFVIALVPTAAAAPPSFAVAIFVIALIPTAAASTLVVALFVELGAQPRPQPLSGVDGLQVQRRRGCAGGRNLTLVTLFSERQPRSSEDSGKENDGDGNWNKHRLTPDNFFVQSAYRYPGFRLRPFRA